ncbi:MAG: nuclear transport factor 2 family protein [Candidatus Zixiibacteriota bacterium]|nr:MAG: nuclear transport factor 2 family protein [candidate division Zixibacteria bacterium]
MKTKPFFFFVFHPDAGSTIVGLDALRRMVEQVFMSEAFKAVAFTVRDLGINISNSGDVAWYSAILDDHGEWQGQPSSWINTRRTGILEKRVGNRVIVQMHFSFAVDAAVDDKAEDSPGDLEQKP